MKSGHINSAINSVLIVLLLLLVQCNNPQQKEENKNQDIIFGNWYKKGHNSAMKLNLSKQNLATVIVGENGKEKYDADFVIKNDTILFIDRNALDTGAYVIKKSPYYVAFDLINDDRSGRVKKMMGFWVRPHYDKQLRDLTKLIKDSSRTQDYLTRARMYLALGNPKKAQFDLNFYLSIVSTDSRAYLHRAATYFPYDMEHALADCNRALELDSVNKNIYFLRGLALYMIGREEEACNDFNEAIELGFSVLRQAESERCKEFWGQMVE